MTYAPLAQLAEQQTLNLQVLGSSPRGRTNYKRQISECKCAHSLRKQPHKYLKIERKFQQEVSTHQLVQLIKFQPPLDYIRTLVLYLVDLKKIHHMEAACEVRTKSGH